MAREQKPDWYLQEWLEHFGKKQASLVNELGWNKSKAHFVWHSDQSYRRELVNEVSAWLGIEPYELLMPPAEALAMRLFRETAASIASQSSAKRAVKDAAGRSLGKPAE